MKDKTDLIIEQLSAIRSTVERMNEGMRLNLVFISLNFLQQ